MPLSAIVDGKVLDWHFKKRSSDTLFYIGDILVGQIFRNRGDKTWSAVGVSGGSGLCPVYGFARRYDAAEFLLTLEGYNSTKHGSELAKIRDLRKEYPGLEDAWKQYQTMLTLCLEEEK
jgi:hypothetical protein